VIFLRCDGDERIGAGHVGRCVQIARALQSAGAEVALAGSYSGVAERLIAAAGIPAVAPGSGRLGVPVGADGVVLDSYEFPMPEIEALGRDLPVAAISDGGPVPRVAAVLDYHLDAAPGVLKGPDYAPVSPRYAAARRPRGFERALLSLGGSRAGGRLLEGAAAALEDLGLEVSVVGAAESLEELAGRADVAVSGAGLTAYELACAGVPSLLLAIADSQRRVASAFEKRSIALALDAGEQPASPRLRVAVGALAGEALRAGLAAAGPAAVDGYGAFRVRDALLAAFGAKGAPRVLRYRPAGEHDGARLLEWRNDPSVRKVSRHKEPIGPDEHERWLASVLVDPRRPVFVVEEGRRPAGSVRFDVGSDSAEISIALTPHRRGHGIGTQAIRESSELLLASHPELTRVAAEVEAGNRASVGAFERAGFMPTGEGPTGRALLVLERR
jgi:spore coat polysaccharide biosynthesis predicted glycosyltransferase SpsG/RimJ/RimL family protein N-acetyltransferase